MAIKVSGVKIGDLEVNIDGGEGATLKQVLTAVGIAQEGQQFIINGDRKAPVTNPAGTRIMDGDTIEVFDRPQAGVCKTPGCNCTLVLIPNGLVVLTSKS